MQAASTIPTQPTSSNNTNIANTAFVKAALLAFLTDRNFIKAVMDAIGSETLSQYGVKYNFDNPNAWSISLGRLFGGLILQGGWNVIPEGKTTSVQLPTVFITRAFRPLVTWDDPTTAIKSSTIFSCGASANTSTITIGLHTENNNGGRGVNWWVIGF